MIYISSHTPELLVEQPQSNGQTPYSNVELENELQVTGSSINESGKDIQLKCLLCSSLFS